VGRWVIQAQKKKEVLEGTKSLSRVIKQQTSLGGMSPVQMIMIFKRNTSLHSIKYLHPIKCIPKKINRKTNKNL